MKTKKIILVLFAIQLSTYVLGQIKVVPGGNVVLSRKLDPSAWVLIGETEQNVGKIYPLARLISKGVNTSCLTLVHEAYTQNPSDWPLVSVGRSNYGNAKHWINILGNSHNSFSTTLGNTYARCYLVSSDLNIKKDITDIPNALTLISQLRGVSYKFIPESFCGDSCDEISLAAANNDRMHFGFISQEVESVIPNITVDVETGNNQSVKSIAYDEIIPLLVEAIKTQQNQITQLNNRLSECCGYSIVNRVDNAGAVTDGNKSLGKTSTDESLNSKAIKNNQNSIYSRCKLFQNNPNPFNEKTIIRYELAEGFKNARIYLYNLQGEQIKSLNVTQSGQGSVEISNSELNAGIYFYSLIIDNVEIDTYKMILTK